MARSCVDCFWCKINRSKGTLRCSVTIKLLGVCESAEVSNWEKSNGDEIVIKLKVKEIKTPFIEWREIFKLAKTCISMKSMD